MAGSTRLRNDRELRGSELNFLGRIELGAKLGAAAIAVTYITGYLTVSTYLAGYGIHTDSSDLFRAKYMYVGFHYWLFTVFLLVFLTLLWRTYIWLMSTGLGDRQRELPVTLKEAEDGQHYPIDSPRGALRWSIVVSLMFLILLGEIMFSNPGSFARYGSLRVAWLFHVLLFQLHRYAVLNPYFHTTNPFIRKPLYLWGSVYGKKWNIAEWVPWYCVTMLITLGCFLVWHDSVCPFRTLHYKIYWSLCVFSIACDILCLCFLSLGAKGYMHFDKGEWPQLREECKYRKLRFLLCFLPAPILVVSYRLFESNRSHYVYSYYLIACILQLLVIVIIANIWLLSAKRFRRDRAREAGATDSTKARDEFMGIGQSQGWILRIAAGTVLYIVSVLGFTRLVYPLIPADKAGGNYDDDTRRVSIGMMVQSPIGICPSIPANETYVLLEENNSWVFLAKGMPGGGGRLLGDGTISKPKEVYAVNRNCIAYMNGLK